MAKLRKNTKGIRAERRAAAEVRNEAYSKLTADLKVALLDQAFGAGKGAKKVRAKIAKSISKSIAPKAVAVVPEATGAKAVEAPVVTEKAVKAVKQAKKEKAAKEKGR